MKDRHRDDGTGGRGPIRRNILRARTRTVAAGMWRKLPISAGWGWGWGWGAELVAPKFLVWMPGRKMMPSLDTRGNDSGLEQRLINFLTH